MSAFRFIRCRDGPDFQRRLRAHPGRRFDTLESLDSACSGADRFALITVEADGLAVIPVRLPEAELSPAVAVTEGLVFVGLGDSIWAFSRMRGRLQYQYRMPEIFSAFLRVDEKGLVVADRRALVGLTPGGDELWCHIVDLAIDSVALRGDRASGETVDGAAFSLDLAENPNNTLPNQGRRLIPRTTGLRARLGRLFRRRPQTIALR